jgi:hypothetical protein
MPAKQAPIKDSKGKWIKGQSGNPKGRPPGKAESLTEILREYGEKKKELGGKTLSLKVHLAETVYTAIIQGYRLVEGEKITLNDTAWTKLLEWLYDRVDGKPTENIQISNPEVELTSEDMAAAMAELAEWEKHAKKNS